MASQTQVGKHIPHGVNEQNQIIVTAVLSSALAAAQILTLRLPEGVDKDLLPVWVRAYSNATPQVELAGPGGANLGITSHNIVTGETVITAAGAGVANGAKVLVGYVAG